MKYLQDGQDLFDAGYQPIPINKGTKVCRVKGWPQIQVTKKQFDAWTTDRRFDGWAIRTADFPAIDIDVKDEKTAQRMVTFCRDLLGEESAFLTRVGLAPKVLIPCRNDGESFKKIVSKSYRDVEGDNHKIEILGRGQYYVAFGTHPDTGKAYHWGVEQELWQYDPDQLPILTAEMGEEICRHFEGIVPQGWRELVGSSDQPKSTNEDWFLFRNPLDVSDSYLRECLNGIDPDIDHDTWLNIGFGLYHQYRGSEVGFDAWHNWSAKSKSGLYKGEAHMRQRWDSMSILPEGRAPVTARVVTKLGRMGAGGSSDLELALERYVLVTQGVNGTGTNRVADLETRPDKAVMSYPAFEGMMANKLVPIPAPTASDPSKEKLVPLGSNWRTHPDRKTVWDTTYLPGGPKIVAIEEQEYFNTFHQPGYGDQLDYDQLDIFFELMEFLFPVPTERKWFLDWMAFCYQYPRKRCQIAPLHISPATGTGRGSIVQIMQKVLGHWNISTADMKDVMSGNFNEYLDQTTLCAIDEVGSGGTKYTGIAAINAMITENYVNVNRKFGAKGTQRIYCNLFLMSNEADAIAIPVNDRRINVFMCDQERKPIEFYGRLKAWIGEDGAPSHGINNLRTFLARRDLRDFDHFTPIQNDARMRMMRATMTEPEQAFLDFLNSNNITFMTTNQIIANVARLMGDDGFELGSRQMSAIIRKYCDAMPRRTKVDGRMYTVWLPIDPIKRVDAKRAANKKPGIVKQYLERQEFTVDGDLKEGWGNKIGADD